jgi:hypothetical protein
MLHPVNIEVFTAAAKTQGSATQLIPARDKIPAKHMASR